MERTFGRKCFRVSYEEMLKREPMLFRPPGEADSLILRVADGCPWNRCTFCGMYKGVAYRSHGIENVQRAVRRAGRADPEASRIFLADGDVMHLDAETLEAILLSLNQTFPRLARVGLYANGASILSKRDAQLRRLKELKLHTLYMGLESGDEATLAAVRKRETPGQMIEACRRAQAAGLRMSVMILTGLAGKDRSVDHARATATVLNAMQPRLLSALRIVTVPGTPMAESGFRMMPEHDAVAELRELIAHLELQSTVFRADHTSNIFPLEGRFPKDKQRLIDQLDALLACGRLDRTSPGPRPWSL